MLKVLNLASCFPHRTIALSPLFRPVQYLVFCFQERSMAEAQTNWLGVKYHQDVENEQMCLIWMRMDALLNLVYF